MLARLFPVTILAVTLVFGSLTASHSIARAQGPALFDLDCALTGRACFDVRVELLLRAEFPIAGFYPPPPMRRPVIEREVYRQLLMDRTAFSCEPIGGQEVLTANPDRFILANVVSAAEAYRSGLPPREMAAFLTDTLNLTVISRDQYIIRGGADPALYLPDRNACWYVWNFLVVKQRWILSVDDSEAEAIGRVFSGCFPERFARISCLDRNIDRDFADAERGRL